MAKVYSDLYPALTRFDNVLLAYQKAVRGKRGHPQVAAFEFERERGVRGVWLATIITLATSTTTQGFGWLSP